MPLVTTEVLTKGTGFKANWVQARFGNSRKDYLLYGKAVYDTELIQSDCEAQLLKSKTRNPVQAKKNTEMLMKMKEFCENYNINSGLR